VTVNANNYDTFLNIYTRPFDPASPLTRCIVGVDDYLSQISVSQAVFTATAGALYDIVVSGYQSSHFGTYTVTVAGQSTAVSGPPTALLGVGRE
jgi:hypothetical protein